MDGIKQRDKDNYLLAKRSYSLIDKKSDSLSLFMNKNVV